TPLTNCAGDLLFRLIGRQATQIKFLCVIDLVGSLLSSFLSGALEIARISGLRIGASCSERSHSHYQSEPAHHHCPTPFLRAALFCEASKGISISSRIAHQEHFLLSAQFGVPAA